MEKQVLRVALNIFLVECVENGITLGEICMGKSKYIPAENLNIIKGRLKLPLKRKTMRGTKSTANL